jgi:hypothetical protein
MATETRKCPNCGAQTTSKFCPECGTPLGERACPSCGAKLAPRAKFCPDCGTPVAPQAARPGLPAGAVPTPAAGMGAKLPWIIAAVAAFALIAVVIVVVSRRPAAGGASAAGTGTAPFNPSAATTDISQMTPRQAADRLFDRVMRASSSGDSQQVQFFGPMTLQAYTSVTPLDADARLHLGLVDLALGNGGGAAAEADTIARESRTHLFALALRAQAAERQGNQAAARTAYKAFLDNYDRERAKNLPEYREHETFLTDLRSTAQRTAGR